MQKQIIILITNTDIEFQIILGRLLNKLLNSSFLTGHSSPKKTNGYT